MSGSCNCKCDDKLLDLNWCESDRSLENIKRSGDIVRDSEQCYITSNTEKGISHIYCHSRKLIATLCQTMDRITRIQKKVKKLCEAQHCMDNTVDVINDITSKRNREKVKRLRGITFKENESIEVIYKKAKEIYDEEIRILNKNTARLDQIKKDSTTETKDGIYLSGTYNESGRGSYDYYSGFSIATAKEDVDYVVGGIGFGDNPPIKFVGEGLKPGVKVKLNHVAKTTTGKNVNVEVKIKNFHIRSDAHTFYDHDYESAKYITVYSSTGGIAFDIFHLYRVEGSFTFTDDEGRPLNLMIVCVVNDIDYQQGFWAKLNNSQTIFKIPNGADIGQYGSGYFNNISGSGVSNESSIPAGSMLFAGIGTVFDFEILGGHPDTGKQYGEPPEGADYVMEFFGNTFKGEVLDLHIPERPLPPIKKCDLIDCDISCFVEPTQERPRPRPMRAGIPQ